MKHKLFDKSSGPATKEKSEGTSEGRRKFLTTGVTAALAAAGAVASAKQQRGPQFIGRQVGGGNQGTINHQGGGTGAGFNSFQGGLLGGPISGASLDPFAQYWSNPTLRLARRITYGVKMDELATVSAKNYSTYLNEQLDWQSIDDSAVTSWLDANYPDRLNPITQLYTDMPDYTRLFIPYMYYSIYTKRQMHARMVEFWLDHFNILWGKPGAGRMLEYVFQRIFTNATTSFRNLLEVVFKSPAMMVYLDNDINWRGQPNINYARELMELHTISVNGGYNETDVNEVGRILSGWRIQHSPSYPNWQEVIFDVDKHELGNKVVMNHTFLGTGEGELGDLLDYLCAQETTHKFLCTKLYKFFIGREPTDDEVMSFSDVWTNTNSDIKALMRNVLQQTTVMSSPSLYKRPNHLYFGMVRQMGLTVTDWGRYNKYYLEPAGIGPFQHVDPDGYPINSAFWINSHVKRLDRMMSVASGTENYTSWNPATLVPDRGSSAEVIEDLNQLLFCGELPVTEKIWMNRYLRTRPITDKTVRETMAIALGSPSYQWC